MKIAISGGTGFLGRPLVQKLVSGGHSVLVLTRRPEQEALSFPPGVTTAAFDGDKALEPHVLEDMEAVVHLTGEPVAQRWTPSAKAKIVDSRIRSTERIVEAVRATSSVRTLLGASAVGYYGMPDDALLTEDSPPGSDFLAQVCVAWEAALFAAPEAIRTVALRTGVVLHPQGGALKPLLLQFRLGVGGPVAGGHQYLSWIHREDWVSLVVFALENPAVRGPLNLTAPHPVTNRDFAQALGHAIQRPSLVPTPAFALRLVLGDAATVVTKGQRVLPRRALDAGFTFRYPDLPAALGNLFSGWSHAAA